MVACQLCAEHSRVTACGSMSSPAGQHITTLCHQANASSHSRRRPVRIASWALHSATVVCLQQQSKQPGQGQLVEHFMVQLGLALGNSRLPAATKQQNAQRQPRQQNLCQVGLCPAGLPAGPCTRPLSSARSNKATKQTMPGHDSGPYARLSRALQDCQLSLALSNSRLPAATNQQNRQHQP
jgi:hypothetical protein